MADTNSYSDRKPKQKIQTPSAIALNTFGTPRSLTFVGLTNLEPEETDKGSVVGAAVCLCRPVVVLGGILVSMLFLSQGVLGNYVISIFSQILLVGYSCMSAFTSLAGFGAALYLLSGQFTVACVSTFHGINDKSVTQLRIVECLSLMASVPCLLGAIACFLSAALSARASKRTTKKHDEPRIFLYLQSDEKKEKKSCKERRGSQTLDQSLPTAPTPELQVCPENRAGTPPPSYNQVSEESYA